MFTENELGLLVAGPGEIDLDDWQRLAFGTTRGSPGLSRPCEAVVVLIGRRVTDGAIVGRTRGRCRRQCAYSTHYRSSRHSLTPEKFIFSRATRATTTVVSAVARAFCLLPIYTGLKAIIVGLKAIIVYIYFLYSKFVCVFGCVLNDGVQ